MRPRHACLGKSVSHHRAKLLAKAAHVRRHIFRRTDVQNQDMVFLAVLYLTSQEITMDKLSVYDAKAHFSELIERAQSGHAAVITKRRHVVAKIVPAKEPVWDRSAVLDEAEALRRKLKIKGRFKIADLIAAGRL